VKGILCEGDWVVVERQRGYSVGHVVKVWPVAGDDRLVQVDFNASAPHTFKIEEIIGRLALWGE
jgi:hypothetical protein